MRCIIISIKTIWWQNKSRRFTDFLLVEKVFHFHNFNVHTKWKPEHTDCSHFGLTCSTNVFKLHIYTHKYRNIYSLNSFFLPFFKIELNSMQVIIKNCSHADCFLFRTFSHWSNLEWKKNFFSRKTITWGRRRKEKSFSMNEDTHNYEFVQSCSYQVGI